MMCAKLNVNTHVLQEMFAWPICCLMLFQLVSCLSGRRLTEDALYCAGECELLGDNILICVV